MNSKLLTDQRHTKRQSDVVSCLKSSSTEAEPAHEPPPVRWAGGERRSAAQFCWSHFLVQYLVGASVPKKGNQQSWMMSGSDRQEIEEVGRVESWRCVSCFRTAESTKSHQVWKCWREPSVFWMVYVFYNACLSTRLEKYSRYESKYQRKL